MGSKEKTTVAVDGEQALGRAHELQKYLDQGWKGLFFEPRLEQEFRRFVNREYALFRRSAVLVSGIAMLLLVAVDHLLLGARLPPLAVALMIGGICVPAFAAYLLSGFRWFRVRSKAAFGILLSNTVILLYVYTLLTGDGRAPPYTYEVLFFQVTFAYFFTGMLFIPSCVIGFGVWAGYLLTQAAAGLSTPALIESGLYLLALNAAGALARYVSERRERRQFLSAELLTELAEQDPLTGLLNRRAFGQYTRRTWRQAQRDSHDLSIAVIDLDNFKAFNDRHGHARGDEVLIAVASTLGRWSARPMDLVARFGGDEFVCLWYGIPDRTISRHADRVRAALSDRVAAFGDEVKLTVSLGVAHGCPSSEADLVTQINRADSALYAAKKAGRNIAAVFMPKATEPQLGERDVPVETR